MVKMNGNYVCQEKPLNILRSIYGSTEVCNFSNSKHYMKYERVNYNFSVFPYYCLMNESTPFEGYLISFNIFFIKFTAARKQKKMYTTICIYEGVQNNEQKNILKCIAIIPHHLQFSHRLEPIKQNIIAAIFGISHLYLH